MNYSAGKEDYVLELEGFTHVLADSNRKDVFTVYVDTPIRLQRGKFISILGESGCGKTTLLTLIGLLRAPNIPKEHKTAATFNITVCEDGESVTYDILKLWKRRDYKMLEKLRRKYIGFALQEGELLLSHSVSQNIAVPMALNGLTGEKAEVRIQQLLNAFGLCSGEKDLKNAHIQNLSGGEKQRVVLARAIAHSPQLVFIDEPTAALNRGLAERALENLKSFQSESTIVMITHDEHLANKFSDVIIRMKPDGTSGHVESCEPIEGGGLKDEDIIQQAGSVDSLEKHEWFPPKL